MPGWTDVTRRRLTSTAAILLTGAALSTPAAARRLDRSRLGALRFGEDFEDFRPYLEAAQVGRWRTQFGRGQVIDGEFSRTHGDAELQCYVDPAFAGLGLNPFRVRRTGSGAELDIALWPTPPRARAACFNRPFLSGILNSELCFTMEEGYWEVAARMPKVAEGLLPGVWLVPADRVWPPEIDLIEVHRGQAICTTHTAQNGKHEFDVTPLPQLGDLSDRVHLFGLLHDGRTLTWFIDDQQVKTAPVAADQHRPFLLLINMCVVPAMARGPIAPTTTATLTVRHIRAYALRA